MMKKQSHQVTFQYLYPLNNPIVERFLDQKSSPNI
jgi:hypothetical protein